MTDVALIIPTLNRAALLRSAIDTALRCEPKPDEVVVVDCGSVDHTREVIRSFGNDVELVERRLPNAASARNVGLTATRSPYVGFLDSDDEALRGKTGGLSNILDAHTKAVLVHGAIEVISEAGESLAEKTSRYAEESARAAKIGTSYQALASFCFMYTSATLIRRSAIDQVGGYDESLNTYEDWDLYLRLSRIGRLLYADVPAARYRLWPGNVGWDHTARGIVEVAYKHLAMLHTLPPHERRPTAAALHQRLAGSLYTLVELREARRQAIKAVRLDPKGAVMSPHVRRALTRWWIPASVLERRRPPRSPS